MYKKANQTDTRLAKNLPQRRYRPELHGLRGLAILGVVLFHLFGQGRVSGGIDIFLAISGFLFTGMLLREVTENHGTINFIKYFGRLFRRIFVPAAIVIAATVGVGLIVFPTPQHGQVWTEALASLLYFENVELIRSHLAYEAASQDVSPFQHFWSLSVQGQFYLVLPVVILIAYWLARSFKTSVTRVMGWVLVLVLIVSLTYAVYVGSYAQDEAYLMTRTRMWQFAFGGIIAICIDRIRLTNTARNLLGILGLTAIIIVGFVLDGANLFPGPWAFWPLLGFALVLLAAPSTAAEEQRRWSAPNLLSNRFFGWIGDHAYGLYLWHWPLLVFYLTIRDRDAVGLRGALIIFAATVVLSMIMQKFIEQPLDRVGKFRNSPRLNWVSLGAGITVMALGVVTALPNLPRDGDRVTTALELNTKTHPGALSISDDYSVTAAELIPSLNNLHREYPPYKYQDCEQKGGEEPGTDQISVCEDPERPENPSATVVIAGGSHAGHWEPAVRAIGKTYNWEVLVVTKSGCVFQDTDDSAKAVCQSWNENFIEWLAENDVDLVITSGTRVFSEESIYEGAAHRWEQIREQDVDLLLVRGTPRPRNNGGRCLQAGGTPQQCGTEAGPIAEPNPLQIMNLPEGTKTFDMNSYVCPARDDGAEAWCDAAIGNIIVWYDGSHLTPQYAYSMAPAFEREMHEVFPEYLK